MPRREELKKLLHLHSKKDTVSPREANWNDVKPIRRPLRPATRTDRVLIFIFVFVASCLLTGAGYLYIVSSAERPHHIGYHFYETYGDQARLLFYGICLLGGIIGVIAYAIISIADPYGTVAAEEAERKRKAEREEMLAELLAAKRPVHPPHEQAIRQLAEHERLAAEQAAAEKDDATENQKLNS